ncbi:hypothetical protein BACINT_03442 [Bacteroides intestinalis DSM 17393]|uniref:Uncharacterized protein n=1 Tax=Bacteroides intestinalis DSM 17393 TaxID=471870 RepID=B3CB56_9BACE|nr:hypothetical protein BACINT_03442 [Bacteroides intestinalis DSM 17393]
MWKAEKEKLSIIERRFFLVSFYNQLPVWKCVFLHNLLCHLRNK